MADTKISALSAAAALAGTEAIPGVQTGANVKLTPAQLLTYALGTGSSASTAGFRGIPLNVQSANYTTVMADAGGGILHPASDANARTFTIDSNANVAYPVGATLTFINRSANNVTIAITTDTLTLSPGGTTGSRTLAQYGMATAIKIGTTEWMISGTGLT